MSIQVIEKDGKPEWAVIPYAEYERLVEEAEMLHDVRAYDEAIQAVAAGEELIPSEVTYALLDGSNPVRVWREYRGLTQQQLAEAAGISVPYLSQIEAGKRRGSAEVLAAIARKLALSLDDLVDV
jgi:DNA-binding XRE family transcriptional regulator